MERWTTSKGGLLVDNLTLQLLAIDSSHTGNYPLTKAIMVIIRFEMCRGKSLLRFKIA